MRKPRPTRDNRRFGVVIDPSGQPDWLLWLQLVLLLALVSLALSAYLRLPFAVLGAVLAGWALLMLLVVRGPVASGAAWALPAVALSLAVLFVLDTGMSLLLGYPCGACGLSVGRLIERSQIPDPQ